MALASAAAPEHSQGGVQNHLLTLDSGFSASHVSCTHQLHLSPETNQMCGKPMQQQNDRARSGQVPKRPAYSTFIPTPPSPLNYSLAVHSHGHCGSSTEGAPATHVPPLWQRTCPPAQRRLQRLRRCAVGAPSNSRPGLVVGLHVSQCAEHGAVALEARTKAQHPDPVALLGAHLHQAAMKPHQSFGVLTSCMTSCMQSLQPQ